MNLDKKKWIDFWVGNFLILVLKPVVCFLGKLLKRNHNPIPQGEVAFLKLLGGGSLVIALPALLSVKNQYPNQKMLLITTPAIKPFAETLGIFDDYVVINDNSLKNLIISSFKALKRLWRIDTIVDYEVHSRLSTLFCLFTCARNRLGFYREDVKDRQFLATHTVFFNLFYGSWYFYEQLSKLLGCEILGPEIVRDHMIKHNNLKKDSPTNLIKIGIGHGCSDLSPERMLGKEQWLKHFQNHLEPNSTYELHFFGGPKEKQIGDDIIEYLNQNLKNASFINQCGKLKLVESIQKLFQMDEFHGIDSALLHFSRLMGLDTIAYFGPTMPQSLIKPLPYLKEKIYYNQLACSPCVHVTETPPCLGNNQCIKNLFD